MPRWAGAGAATFFTGTLVAVFDAAVFFVVAMTLLCHDSANLTVAGIG
jgi:hypothetical protein